MTARRRKRVFVSFDYADKDLKDDFVYQSQQRDIQISIVDNSLREAHPSDRWVAQANRMIQDCDVFMVIMGRNAHQAPGVLREVSIAAGLKKPRFQLRPRKRYGYSLKNAGEVIRWRWKRLEPWFTIDAGRSHRGNRS